MKIRRIVFLILIIINCITIFYFSNQVADTSSNSSGRVVQILFKTIPSLRSIPDEYKAEIGSQFLQPIVRKTAHFILYALLGIFTINFALTCKGSVYQNSLCSWVFGTLYGITDEIHQLFIQGRSCEFRDMFIDSFGILIGILLTVLVLFIISKILNEPKEKQPMDKKNTKILFISSTGGHFSELMQLKPIMKKCNYHIVTEKTSTNKNLKARYRHRMSFLVYETKKHPFKYIFVLFANCFISLYIYLKFRPQIIITTGTHTAGPMCCIGKILGSKIIYIETFANRKTKTVTGRVLYHIADEFIVQWEDMLKLYPKAKFFGWIY